ncbi:MAG: glycosyltransferase family 2 protein [Pseudomonadota bacterium]
MVTEIPNGESNQSPRVTIGVPVYNGDAYLAEALDSILNQTFTDFEVIISDNASTDGTEQICRDYAARDDRVRYIRQEKNLGAAPNFNLLVPIARGEYFKWAASDDLIAPEFLNYCVEALEKEFDASLAMTQTQIIDEQGGHVSLHEVNQEFADPEQCKRFKALLPMSTCFEVFGLMRTEKLRKTKLIIGSSHGDGVLLAALGVLGPFEIVEKPLFKARKHPKQSVNLHHDRRIYSEWFDISNRGKLLVPTATMLKEFGLIPFAHPLTFGQRWECIKSLLRFSWSNRLGLKHDLKFTLRFIFLRFFGELRN